MMYYTVRGSWPFPADMLRYDGSVPVSSDDEEKISLLSKDYAKHRSLIAEKTEINLISEFTPKGEVFPSSSRKRWESFGWEVIVPEDPLAKIRADFEAESARMKTRAQELIKDMSRDDVECLKVYFQNRDV